LNILSVASAESVCCEISWIAVQLYPDWAVLVYYLKRHEKIRLEDILPDFLFFTFSITCVWDGNYQKTIIKWITVYFKTAF